MCGSGSGPGRRVLATLPRPSVPKLVTVLENVPPRESGVKVLMSPPVCLTLAALQGLTCLIPPPLFLAGAL